MKASANALSLSDLKLANEEASRGKHGLHVGDSARNSAATAGHAYLLNCLGTPARTTQHFINCVLEVHKGDCDKVLKPGPGKFEGIVDALAQGVNINGRLSTGREGPHSILTFSA